MLDITGKLENVPKEYKFQYLRSTQEIVLIREKLKDFFPKTDEEQKWLEEILKQYEYHFKVLEKIENISKIS